MPTSATAVQVGIVSRGDQRSAGPATADHRLERIIQALQSAGAAVDPVVFSEETADEVRERLMALDGALVWVDPIDRGHDRTVLDAVLREVAAAGVWVSADPDVILKMGAKDVLVRTRGMEWGTDSYEYTTFDDLSRQLPARLSLGPRVLKQYRGNGGNGVWKVLMGEDDSDQDPIVQVLHALGGSRIEELRLSDALDRFRPYFANGGSMIDQPYQSRLGEGMVRCYVVGDRVAGFGRQFVTALLPPPTGTIESPAPPPRVYFGPDEPPFQALRRRLESHGIAEMQRLCDVGADSLPAIWDADFLLGPKTLAGEDTYVLCEINVSSVFPFPDEATDPLAEFAVISARRARDRRW